MVVPQKIKHRITILSNNSTSRYTPKRIERRVSKSYLFTYVHSSIIHNSQKVEEYPKCPTRDEWINKIWSILIVEYYSALKRMEILPWPGDLVDWNVIPNTKRLWVQFPVRAYI